jgi:prepilin-type N-terminal cleavage/methylation domain-containing protein
MQHNASADRQAFTLVELLVVIGLMVVLMSLGLYLIPSVNDEQKATRAATQLQQWLEIAKQRAARDRAPRGVRLLQGSVSPTQVTDLEYTEQPPDFFFGNSSTYPNIVSRARCTAVDVGLARYTMTFEMYDMSSGSFGAGIGALPRNLAGNGGTAPVQVGDHLELLGQVFVVQTIVNANTIFAATKLPTTVNAGFATTQYRFVRQPQVIGDDPLQMPQNLIIDCQARGVNGGVYDLNRLISAGPIDIMFAPDGRVVGQMASFDKIILWVRDVTVTDGQNDPALVCIYPRTGLIAACPVDTSFFSSGTSPYTFTATGRRSS